MLAQLLQLIKNTSALGVASHILVTLLWPTLIILGVLILIIAAYCQKECEKLAKQKPQLGLVSSSNFCAAFICLSFMTLDTHFVSLTFAELLMNSESSARGRVRARGQTGFYPFTRTNGIKHHSKVET